MAGFCLLHTAHRFFCAAAMFPRLSAESRERFTVAFLILDPLGGLVFVTSRVKTEEHGFGLFEFGNLSVEVYVEGFRQR